MQHLFEFEVAFTLSGEYARMALNLNKLLNNTCHSSPVFKSIQNEVKRLQNLSKKVYKDSKRYYKQYEMVKVVNIADMPKSTPPISLKRPRSDSTETQMSDEDPRNFRTQSQFQTSINFWASEVDDLRRDITKIKTLLVKFESILISNQTKQLEFLQLYFNRQSAQLVACQEAFQANVDRDEELRTTLCESADPWGGC